MVWINPKHRSIDALSSYVTDTYEMRTTPDFAPQNIVDLYPQIVKDFTITLICTVEIISLSHSNQTRLPFGSDVFFFTSYKSAFYHLFRFYFL